MRLASNSTANNHTGTATLTSLSPEPPDGSNGSYVLSRSEYDRAGRMIQQIANNTAQTILAYDGAGRTRIMPVTIWRGAKSQPSTIVWKLAMRGAVLTTDSGCRSSAKDGTRIITSLLAVRGF